MRKIILAVVMVMCSVAARAGEYNYLVFSNTDGTTTAFSVSGLTLTVNGSELQVSNSAGTVSLVLTDLSAMQFSREDTLTALGNVIEGDSAVEVFSLSGVRVGTYGSWLEAAGALQAGTYVMKQGKNAQKIVVR